jgi:SAM-dependent MidA family methyltransferase
VDVSGALRHRQSQRLRPFGDQVQWLDAWPAQIKGVVLGNEVLDAMPVQLLHWDGHTWFERGVATIDGQFVWADRATALRPPHEGPFLPGSTVEIHPQAEAFMRSLAERLQRGAALFIDYGFPQAEYYHPQRQGGTLMCHQGHRADTNPLVDIGDKDITAHVNFSAVALAAQDAGLHVLGYTTQAHALINCGLLDLLQDADARARAAAQVLMAEHEMGELFKVLGLSRGITLDAMAFVRGDRSHTL